MRRQKIQVKWKKTWKRNMSVSFTEHNWIKSEIFRDKSKITLLKRENRKKMLEWTTCYAASPVLKKNRDRKHCRCSFVFLWCNKNYKKREDKRKHTEAANGKEMQVQSWKENDGEKKKREFKTESNDDDDDLEGRGARVSWTTKQLVLRHERERMWSEFLWIIWHEYWETRADHGRPTSFPGLERIPCVAWICRMFRVSFLSSFRSSLLSFPLFSSILSWWWLLSFNKNQLEKLYMKEIYAFNRETEPLIHSLLLLLPLLPSQSNECTCSQVDNLIENSSLPLFFHLLCCFVVEYRFIHASLPPLTFGSWRQVLPTHTWQQRGWEGRERERESNRMKVKKRTNRQTESVLKTKRALESFFLFIPRIEAEAESAVIIFCVIDLTSPSFPLFLPSSSVVREKSK